MPLNLRDEALRILDERGAILDTARELSAVMRSEGLDGAVIGGVAVVLHGHIRTTRDVDLYIPDRAEALGRALVSRGFAFDPSRREFSKEGVPIHLVLPEQTGPIRPRIVEIEGITTVSLADLIGLKLRSGTEDLLRAQDLADVIGLIRHHRLTGAFARHLDKGVRPAFRRFARAIGRGG